MATGRDVFSESTFAFAATNEMSRLDPWWSSHVPIIPSLRRERRGGYDVRFDLPATLLLIQYKLTSDARHLRLARKPRGSTQLVKDLRSECRGGLYQFWTTDHQHRLLDRIARKFPYTYYVAPRFTKLGDLHAHYTSRALMSHSVVMRLSDFPPATRGSSCKHRVISPHSSSRNFVFSKPFVAENVNFRIELRDAWEDWLTEIPFRQRLFAIWEEFPRIGKARALSWARAEVAEAKALFGPQYETPDAVSYRRALPPPIYEDMPVVRPRTPRRPPWPSSLFRNVRDDALIEYDEADLIRLVALARIFDMAGLRLSLLQPSPKALANSDYYDAGT